MNADTQQERRFTLRLTEAYTITQGKYLHWYRHLLDRLGPIATNEVWRQSFEELADSSFQKIMSGGWVPDATASPEEADSALDSSLARLFPEAISGISAAEAGDLVANTFPLLQMQQHFPDLAVQKALSTYDALHVTHHGLASLVETLLDVYGKAGELMAYDILLSEIALADMPQLSVEVFIAQRQARFEKPPTVPDIHSAGLDVTLVKVGRNEIINHVHACEWARYYRTNHPRVGFLLACSCDDAAYRAMNPRLRLERKSTIMEGGEMCDFRIFATAPLEK
jgi:hypothetical protein